MHDSPPCRIVVCDAERREPGMMLFNVRPGGSADGEQVGWLLGIDQEGQTAFQKKYDQPPQDVRALPNGNIVFSQTDHGLINEITRGGEVVRTWFITGKWRDVTPPADATRIDIELSHHRINTLPNGNFLLLSMEVRDIANWPSSDSDPNASKETARVVGDVVLEVAPNGTIAGQWKMLDMVDPYRLCYGKSGRLLGSSRVPQDNGLVPRECDRLRRRR